MFLKAYQRLLCIALVFVLSSCSASSSPSKAPETAASTADIPKRVSMKVTTQLSVEADVLIPEALKTLSADVYAAQKTSFDADEAYRLLGNGDSFSKKLNPKSTIFTMNNGNVLSVGNNSLRLRTVLAPFISNIFIDDSVDPDYNLALYAAQPELSFSPISDAYATIKDTLSALGVDVSKQYECYSMPYAIMQQESQNRMNRLSLGRSEYKLNWTKEEECYLFRFYASAGKLPVIREEHGMPDDGTLVLGSTIDVIYSQKGFELLYLHSIYYPTESIQKDAALISMDDALTQAISLANSIVITGQCCIEHIRLQYIPIKADKNDFLYSLVPSWSFRIVNTIIPAQGDPIAIKRWLHINALNGEEIV